MCNTRILRIMSYDIYLLCITEFHPGTSNHFSQSSSRTCTCRMERVLDKHVGSIERYYINQGHWCRAAKSKQLVQIRIQPDVCRSVVGQTSTVKWSKWLERLHLQMGMINQFITEKNQPTINIILLHHSLRDWFWIP